MGSNGISSGLPVGSAATGAGGGVGVGRCGRRDSRPLPRARRLGSAVAVGMLLAFFSVNDLIFKLLGETMSCRTGPLRSATPQTKTCLRGPRFGRPLRGFFTCFGE